MGSAIVKIARHYQVTVPQAIRKASGLREGELVNFEFKDGVIIMTPVCVIKREQAYFFNEKWQKAIKKSEMEIRKGSYKVYRSGSELEKEIEA